MIGHPYGDDDGRRIPNSIYFMICRLSSSIMGAGMVRTGCDGGLCPTEVRCRFYDIHLQTALAYDQPEDPLGKRLKSLLSLDHVLL